MNNFGRKKITTTYTLEEIEKDEEVLKQVISDASATFDSNSSDIDYLVDYFVGKQDIANRTKEIRPEINNKITVNFANAITRFKTGYLLWKPIEYIARKSETDLESLALLNDYMVILGKDSLDKELGNMQSIAGTTYRLGLVNKEFDEELDNAPYIIRNMDPRNSFIVYSADTGEALLGVIVLRDPNNGNQVTKYQIYSPSKYWVLDNQTQLIEERTTHTYKQIPLIEYPANEQRLGDFEIVLSLLDAINLTMSNALDGVEQFIQSLLVFKNVEINKEMLTQLKELGAINIKQNGEVEANVDYLTQEFNQEQTQKLVDIMFMQIQTICGLPTKNNSGGAGSNTGAGVIIANGWSEAETRANDTELIFKNSERQLLKLILYISRTMTTNKLNLRLMDIDIKFTRRNYENIYQKAQVLDLLLKNPKVEPKYAYQVCGLFQDPEQAYKDGMTYYEEAKKESEEVVNG